MSKAMEVMVNHVDNLKRLYDKERQDLEETRYDCKGHIG